MKTINGTKEKPVVVWQKNNYASYLLTIKNTSGLVDGKLTEAGMVPDETIFSNYDITISHLMIQLRKHIQNRGSIRDIIAEKMAQFRKIQTIGIVIRTRVGQTIRTTKTMAERIPENGLPMTCRM